MNPSSESERTRDTYLRQPISCICRERERAGFLAGSAIPMITMPWTIRSEEPDDAAGIAAVLTDAFSRKDEAELVSMIRNSGAYDPELSLVCVEDGTIVGYVLFSPVVIRAADGDERPALALAPVAVLSQFRNQGIGTTLIEEGIHRSHQKGAKIVVVLGEPGYYRRFRFESAKTHEIEPPWEVPEGYFMVLSLETNALRDVQGTVYYPEAFTRTTDTRP
ncbi:GNAT family N-acetyltransferase [Methanogenium cariaci]|jgi:putative acetyltransferase